MLEFQQALALGLELGTVVAVLDENGQVCFFHGTVVAPDQERLSPLKVAIRLEWAWWLQQTRFSIHLTCVCTPVI